MSLAQAQAKLDAYAANCNSNIRPIIRRVAQWRPRLVPLQQEVVGNSSLMLFLLLAAVGCSVADRLCQYRKPAARPGLHASS